MLSPAPTIDVHALMRGLVHELRNPLSAILTASSLLKGGQDLDDETAMLLGIVEKESRRMNRILTEFSSFVKPPAAQLETFDVAQTLRGLVRDLQKDGALAPNIEVRDELPAELLVSGDAVQIHQAFHHLLSNAAEAMQNGGALCLHAHEEGQTTRIFLDDCGCGLSEDTLESVFQPFFSTKSVSTGLGLSIAHSLIQASGGGISIHNRFDEVPDRSTLKKSLGARVHVQLPRGA